MVYFSVELSFILYKNQSFGSRARSVWFWGMYVICAALMISMSLLGVWNFGDTLLIASSMLLMAPFEMLTYTIIVLLVYSSVNIYAKVRKLGDFTYPFVPVIAAAFPIACYLA